MDKILALNGIEGVFPVKEIATQIPKAVQPAELRRSVEYELSNIQRKENMKDLQLLYNFLVGKYEMWCALIRRVERTRTVRRSRMLTTARSSVG